MLKFSILAVFFFPLYLIKQEKLLTESISIRYTPKMQVNLAPFLGGCIIFPHHLQAQHIDILKEKPEEIGNDFALNSLAYIGIEQTLEK